jgi:hypothetical protein
MENDEIIEIPKNYEEIVARKLEILEKDYQNTIKANFNEEIMNHSSSSSEGDINEEVKDNESEDKIRNLGNNYYQCLDEYNEQDDNEIETVDNFGNVNRLNDEFVEVEEEFRPVDVGTNIQYDQFEFKDEDINGVFKECEEVKGNGAFSNPIKDPQKIKEAMKKIQLPPPRWAQK